MKIRMLLTSLAMVTSLTCVHQANAQTFLDPAGPVFFIGWSSSAALCQLMPGSAASTVNIVTGTVTFAPNSYGTIGLICNMPGIMNGILPADIHYLGYSFSNPNPVAGCGSSAYFVDRSTGKVDGWATDASSRSGIWTANIVLTTATVPLTYHAYDVDIYLYRPKGAVNSCNPVAYAMFMESPAGPQ